MGESNYVQSSFLGGERSQVAQGRIDLPDYRTGMNVCYNSVLTETGAWTRRPGTKYGAHTRGGAAARLITFSFQESSPYTLELTDNRMRFFAGSSLLTESPVAVSAISTATPAVVTTAAQTWVTGDQVMFSSLGTSDPLLLNRQFIATVTDTTHVSLSDAVTGADIDGSTLATFTTGNLGRIVELTVPYTDALWPTVRSVQTELKSVLLQGSVTPQVLTATLPTSTVSATFTLTPAQFRDGPYNDPVIGATLTPASVSGVVGMTMVSPTWSSSTVYNTGDYVVSSSITYQSIIDTNTNNTPASSAFAWAVVAQDKVVGSSGLQTSDIGRHIRLFSEPSAWAVGTTYAAGDSVKYNGVYWTSVIGSNTANRPGLDLTKWSLNPNASVWTWGTITSLTGAVATLISPSAGSLLTFSGHSDWLVNLRYAAGFDGVTAQVSSAAPQNYFGGDGISAGTVVLGKNYTGSAKAVTYAIITAPTNLSFLSSGGSTISFNLRAKATAPTSQSDGTLLGQAVNVSATTVAQSIQIFSNDTTTTWNYIWIECIIPQTYVTFAVAEVSFYTATSFSGTGISVQILGPPLLYTTAITTWRLGLFTSATGYPKCGTYHEGRLWLSGLVSNRFDASAFIDINGDAAPNLFYFTPTSKIGTVSDGNAISYTLAGPDVNAVFWMVPDQQGILIGTQAGEWLVQASALNSPLTPLNIQVHRVTTIGCANIEPRRTEHTLIFAQKHKHKVMEYFSDVFSGKFSAPNLAIYAKHLSSRGIEELGYQKELSPTIWARCTDGSLIGATYKRDSLMSSQGPTYVGWHRHVLGSGRTIESVAIGPSAASATESAGNLDTLAMVTSDASVRHVEFMTNIFSENDTLPNAWFVDSGIIPTITQSVTTAGQLGMRLDGLWHLNGQTIAVFANGLDCGDFLVTSGWTAVPYGSAGGLFTSTFASTVGTKVAAGFTYTSDGQLLRPDTQKQAGTRSGEGSGKVRRTHEFSALLNNTQGISFGTSFATGKLHAAQFRTPGGTAYAATDLYSGVYWSTVADDYSRDGSMLCWRVTRPYPATIASISSTVQTQG